MIVIAAERGGTIRESLQMSAAYRDARQAAGEVDEPELLEEIVESQPQFDPQEYASPEELETNGLQRLTDAASILEAQATSEEVDGCRGFILVVAERVAHAHKSGGILGFGGREVSEAEQARLDRIAAAMGTSE